MALVSIIIPCYNYGHFIEATVDSLLQQTHRDIEVIVINDGSTDDTEKVVKTIALADNRVQCYSFPNAGLGESRNRGIALAKGDFIQFLDADDLLERRKLEVQLNIFKINPDVDIVYGSVRYFRNDPYDSKDRLYTYWGENKEWMPGHSGRGLLFLTQALKAGFSHLSSLLFSRSAVEKAGLFDNDFSAVADYHYILKCVIGDAFFLYHDTADTYSLVRWHPDNMSKNLRLMYSDELKMRMKIKPLLKGYPLPEKTNDYAIKSFEMRLSGSWKTRLLSGGRFEVLKSMLRFLGLERVFKKFFYK